MKLSVEEFRAWKNKSITLVGMSGVGKTHLANKLRKYHWFHYSGDYRIGTRYLDEPILDLIKEQAMRVSFLRDLLRSDGIYIRNNITVDNLGPVLSFVGKLGDPEKGGVPLPDFIWRQELYRVAEIDAMKDVPRFIERARNIYGYDHFINDVGGSLCELKSPEVIELLAKHTLIVYIEVTDAYEGELVQRAQDDPKPLYYRPEFLEAHLAEYLQQENLPYAAMIEPDHFTRWVFPRLFYSRIPRYESIAEPYGYTVTADEVSDVRDVADFLCVLEQAIGRHGS